MSQLYNALLDCGARRQIGYLVSPPSLLPLTKVVGGSTAVLSLPATSLGSVLMRAKGNAFSWRESASAPLTLQAQLLRCRHTQWSCVRHWIVSSHHVFFPCPASFACFNIPPFRCSPVWIFQMVVEKGILYLVVWLVNLRAETMESSHFIMMLMSYPFYFNLLLHM